MPRVPAGATRHFAIAIVDPPASAHDLEVLFEAAPQRAATAPIAVTPPPPPAAPAAGPTVAGRLARSARRTWLSPTVLLTEAEVAERVAALAQAIAPRIDDETVAVCLLTGGLWFCADLMRALSRLGRNVRFDALWLASYGDERASLGRCEVRADLQRPLAGRTGAGGGRRVRHRPVAVARPPGWCATRARRRC